MKINQKFKVLDVAGDYFVVSQGADATDMTTIIQLNATAVELWNAFTGKDFNEADVVSHLMDAYGIDEAQASGDAQAWVDSLKGCGVIC